MLKKTTYHRHYLLRMFTIMILLFVLSGLPAINQVYADDNDISSEKIGTWDGKFAWKFIYNGNLAFCLDSEIPGIPDSSSSTEDIYTPEIVKALYYGWGGEKPWSGFDNNEVKGIVITSRTLSDFFSNSNNDDVEGVPEFKAFLQTQPDPPANLAHFSSTAPQTFWDPQRKVQYTEDLTVLGDTGQTISITLPENSVSLVKEDGTVEQGQVTLRVGDTFHLEADAGIDGTYATGNVGINIKYQGLIIRTQPQNQDLGQIKVFKEDSAITSFQVNWLNFEEITIRKVDIATEKELPGATLQVIDFETGELVDQWVSTHVPHSISNLPAGREYILKETMAPDGYEVSTEEIKFISGKDATVVMKNTPTKKEEVPPMEEKKNTIEESKDSATPDTGDSSPMPLPVIISILSAMSVLLLMGREKKKSYKY